MTNSQQAEEARYDEIKYELYKKATPECASKWADICERLFDKFLSMYEN